MRIYIYIACLILSDLVHGHSASQVLLSIVLLGAAARRRGSISRGLELFGKIKALWAQKQSDVGRCRTMSDDVGRCRTMSEDVGCLCCPVGKGKVQLQFHGFEENFPPDGGENIRQLHCNYICDQSLAMDVDQDSWDRQWSNGASLQGVNINKTISDDVHCLFDQAPWHIASAEACWRVVDRCGYTVPLNRLWKSVKIHWLSSICFPTLAMRTWLCRSNFERGPLWTAKRPILQHVDDVTSLLELCLAWIVVESKAI